MILRESEFVEEFSLADAASLAGQGLGADESGFRSQFIELVRVAESVRES